MARAQERERSENARSDKNSQSTERAERDLRQEAEALAAQLRELLQRLEQASAVVEKGAPAALEVATHRVAQANMELMSFWARRAQASIELPTRIAACARPQDIWAEHTRILAEALTDAQSMIARMLRLWGQAASAEPHERP